MRNQDPKLNSLVQTAIEELGMICGPSHAMRKLIDDISRVAKSDLPVMDCKFATILLFPEKYTTVMPLKQ